MRTILPVSVVSVAFMLICCASAGASPQIKGRAADAGMAPQDGRNAAIELIHQISALEGAFPHSGDGTTVNLTTVARDPAYPPLTENPAIDALAARAKAIYAEIGKTVESSGNGGASESALAMAEGTPALDGLGYVGGDFHTDHEWIDLNSVVPRLYLFTRLLMETGAKPPKTL
jgi:glutamate carboxypeptidase